MTTTIITAAEIAEGDVLMLDGVEATVMCAHFEGEAPQYGEGRYTTFSYSVDGSPTYYQAFPSARRVRKVVA